jgi:hypothetical protein
MNLSVVILSPSASVVCITISVTEWSGHDINRIVFHLTSVGVEKDTISDIYLRTCIKLALTLPSLLFTWVTQHRESHLPPACSRQRHSAGQQQQPQLQYTPSA